MEPSNADLALHQADQLAARAERAARWLARYYIAFGIASLLIAVGFGLLHGLVWTIVLTVLWGGVITAISIYAGRQRTMVRGGGRLHLTVMLVWTLVWVLTVLIGTGFELAWPWWLGGGIALLITCLVGAGVVRNRAGARR